MSDETTTETTKSTGQTSGDWKEGLPEIFADAPFIGAAETPEAALEQIKNAASHMGNSIRIPGEDAGDDARKEFYGKILEKAPDLMPKPTEETMEQFYASMGRPDKPDGYVYEPPEGKEIPPDLEKFAETAHKYGLSQDQFKGVLSEVMGSQWEQMEIAEANHNREMEQLHEEWGLAFQGNLSQVKNFLRLTDAPDGIVELLTEGAMSPKEIKWIHAIANQTKSSVELAQQETTQQTLMTPQEAQNQIQEMLNNTEHPYWNAGDPRHKDAVKRMVQLQQFANPTATTDIDMLRA